MTALLGLLLALGVAPMVFGLIRLRPAEPGTRVLRLGSLLLCALAFNLTFFWQELWLVIPKALTPGLHPAILYHNDHDWTGKRAIAELLQGTGALATLASGLAFLGVLAATTRASATWRLFLFWMAFQGLTQSLTQLVIGTVLPGNDVGRALAYLHVSAGGKMLLLVLAVAGLFAAGAVLARLYPPGAGRPSTALTRAFGWQVLLIAVLAVLLTIPFRLPRNWIEVAFVPLFINLIGMGWLVLGASLVRRNGVQATEDRPGFVVPALALAVVLLVFQLVLRRGIAFG